MAQSTLPQSTRTAKAAGIVERHECEPLEHIPGFWRVTDTATGSGKVRIATAHQCNCPDFLFRGHRCKHMQAIRREAAALEAYAEAWDAAARPSCPQCGAPIVPVQSYVGGRGYMFFEVCSGDGSHYSKRA
jgi:hypothetical protein